MVGLLAGLLRLATWRFILAAVILSEIFTFIANSILSWLWWGHISTDLLWIGSIDAFMVAMLVAPVIMYFFRRAIHLQEINQVLQSETAQRQQVAKGIQRREERYRLLFERSGDCIFIIEADGPQRGRILDANQAAVDAHGFSYDELLSKNIRDLIPPGSSGHSQEIIRRIERGEWVKFEILQSHQGRPSHPPGSQRGQV